MTEQTVGVAGAMEQRWSQRRKVTLDVDVLQVDGQRVASTRTRDVGLGGVFIEMADGRPAEHMELDLVFVLDRQGHATKHRLKARVVRTTADGVGLMFREFDTASFRALQEILRHTPAHESANH